MKQAPGKNMKILIADDNTDYLFLLHHTIRAGGYDVVTARDGAEAIEALESDRIDLILSDILMPRVDGIKLHAWSRQSSRYAKTKFVFVSAFKDIYENVVVLDPAIDFFHDKTSSSDDILDFVNKLVNGDYAGHSQQTLL